MRALFPGIQHLLAPVAAALIFSACGGSGSSTGSDAKSEEWIRVSHDEQVFGGDDEQVMRSVTEGGPGFVAVGWDGVGGDRDAAIWTSANGRSWTRVPHDEETFGGADAQLIASITRGGPGLVAVGLDGSGGDFDAAVWVSEDGLAWERVPHDERSLGGVNFQAMQSVASSDSRLVAAGADTAGGTFDAAVWYSDDGRVWRRVPHDDELFGGPNEQDINAVASGGSGFVAAGLAEFDVPGDRDVAIWTSSDGEEWERVSHDEELFGGAEDQVVMAVVAGKQGLVAVGYDEAGGDRDAAAWRSDDGLTWSRTQLGQPSLGGDGNQVMVGIAAAEGGLIAVGRDEAGGTRWAALWTSSDAVEWDRTPSGSTFEGGIYGPVMLGVADRGGSRVVVGVDGTEGDDDAAAWVYSGRD